MGATSKYDRAVCENVKLRPLCLSYVAKGRVFTLGLIISGIALVVLGVCCSAISVCFLIRKTALRESDTNEKLRHYCKETLKPKGTTVTMCDDHPNVDNFKSKRRKLFSWSDTFSWKSFSKSVLIEPEETQMQNDILFKELTKVMTKHKPDKEDEPSPTKSAESTYFKLPFK